MNLYLKLVITLIFNSISILSFAQITTNEGYIITNNNDTIYGRLEYSYTGFNNKCIFVRKNSVRIEVLKPNQIKQFFISPDINFRTKEINGKKAFFQVLSENNITFYNHGSNLFISCKSDSLVQLKGGNELFNTNSGKYYSKKIDMYKAQLKRCVTDPIFFERIENLKFDKKPILQLVKDINKEKSPSGSLKVNKSLLHTSQFGLEVGFSSNAYFMKNIANPIDTFAISSEGSKPFEYVTSVNRHQTISLIVGLNYKRKISKTNGYLLLGFKYDQMLKSQKQGEFLLHNAIVVPNNLDAYFADTIGKVLDTFNYNLNSISLPVNYYNEISYGKVRPSYSLGITGKYFIKKDFTLNRKVFLNEEMVDEKNINLIIPPFLIGAKFGLGCRYLINMHNSLSAGLNVELYPKSWFNKSNLVANFNKQLYLSYNF